MPCSALMDPFSLLTSSKMNGSSRDDTSLVYCGTVTLMWMLPSPEIFMDNNYTLINHFAHVDLLQGKSYILLGRN